MVAKTKKTTRTKSSKNCDNLADMDRREMENQYEQFAQQYDELKKGIKNDSLLRQLGEAQARCPIALGRIASHQNH